MTHPLFPSLNQWCHENGWSDLFIERYQFWAFPPGGALPLPLPTSVLEELHTRHYRALKYPLVYGLAALGTLVAIALTLLSHSPMPLLAAFVGMAIAVGILDEA